MNQNYVDILICTQLYMYICEIIKKKNSFSAVKFARKLITQMFVSSKYGDRARADYFHFTSMDFDVSMPYALFLLGGQM